MTLTVSAVASWNVPLPAPPHYSLEHIRVSEASHPASDNKSQSRGPRCPGVMGVA